MQVIRSIETVNENGRLELCLDKPAGTRVEVIVLDLEENPPSVKPGDEALALAKRQEKMGFASTVIGSSKLQYLVEASLDSWLTTGRFNEQFERELTRVLGGQHTLTTNSGWSANILEAC